MIDYYVRTLSDPDSLRGGDRQVQYAARGPVARTVRAHPNRQEPEMNSKDYDAALKALHSEIATARQVAWVAS